MMSEDKMKVELTLDNYLNAKIDDIVDVSMGGGYVLTSALIVYLIPLILVGISLFATKSLSEGIQIIGIIISLLIGILIAYISDKKLRNRKGYVPEIINIHQSKEETKNGRQ
jgi:positive regulator of sigma E activity